MAGSQEHAKDAARKIRDLQHQGRIIEVHEYISKLPAALKAEPAVAIPAASQYATSGYFDRASAIIDGSNCKALLNNRDAFVWEDIACLALVAARVKMYTECEWESALTTVNGIEDIYVNLNIHASESSPDHLRRRIDQLCRQSKLLDTGLPPKLQEDSTTMWSDIRTLIEYWMISIRIFAANNGILPFDETISKIGPRFRKLCEFLRYRVPRYFEASFVLLNELDSILGSKVTALEFVDDFATSLKDPRDRFLRASALRKMSVLELNESPKLAAIHSDEALDIYTKGELFHSVRQFLH